MILVFTLAHVLSEGVTQQPVKNNIFQIICI